LSFIALRLSARDSRTVAIGPSTPMLTSGPVMARMLARAGPRPAVASQRDQPWDRRRAAQPAADPRPGTVGEPRHADVPARRHRDARVLQRRRRTHARTQ